MAQVDGTASSSSDSLAREQPDQLTLAAEFDTPSRADWQALVADVLGRSGALPKDFSGAPETLLATRTYDGIEIQPLYTADDPVPEAGMPGLPPFVRGSRPEGNARTGWQVRQLHADTDPRRANDAMLADLEGGVGSVWLRLGGSGLAVSALADALHDVYVDLAPVVLDAGQDYAAAADELLRLAADRGVGQSEVVGNVGADPIGLRARTGQAHEVAPAAELTARLAGTYPQLRGLVADGLPYHEAGGSDAQELGAAVASGVAYLRALTEAGMDVDAAAAQLEFRLAVSADQFMAAAKLRAARRMWARVTEVAGASVSARGMMQHAVTAPAMLTRRDPWVNILRATVACFGAGLGGADSITVLPLDHQLGAPDDFSRRVARNTHAILLEESKLAGVIDPVGGSWYVESLTDALAQQAWREFTDIEREGGIESTLDSGFLADRLAATWDNRRSRIATRADPITGVSEYPHLDEQSAEPAQAPAEERAGGLPRIRYAQDYEQLRDLSDAHLTDTGARPAVFLATLGPLAGYTTRATFASNLLQAGGIDSVEAGPTETVHDVIAAYRDTRCVVTCVCGSDAAYAEQADDVATELKKAGARTVLLAGKPVDEYRDVDGFIYAGCDALDVLTSILQTLGVAS